MLLRCYLHQEAPHWRLGLEKMLQRGVKFEIEAFIPFPSSPMFTSHPRFKLTCVLKVKLDCQTCRMKVMEVLQAIREIFYRARIKKTRKYIICQVVKCVS